MGQVRGLLLPAVYEALVADRTWTSDPFRALFKARSGSKYMSPDAYFLRPDQMDGWIVRMERYRQRVGPEALGRQFLIDSTGPDHAVPGDRIDLQRGLPLADNGGEAWLWLDYREGSDPRVLEFVDAPPRWEVLAPTFDVLAARVGRPG